MKFLKGFILLVLLIASLVGTWQFDYLFLFVEEKVNVVLGQIEVSRQEEVKPKSYKLSKSILENGAFLNYPLELSQEEYGKLKYLQAFQMKNCGENEVGCLKLNMHVLWKGDQFVFMNSRSVDDVSYYGYFDMDRSELLDYLKNNKNEIVVKNECDQGQVSVEDELGAFGPYFRAKDCGVEIEMDEIKDGFWVDGLRIFLADKSRRKDEIGNFLIESGFTCVSFGETEVIELVSENELNLNECSFFETTADLSLELLEELYGYASSFQKVETVL